jgi:hypothetical protein
MWITWPTDVYFLEVFLGTISRSLVNAWHGSTGERGEGDPRLSPGNPEECGVGLSPG